MTNESLIESISSLKTLAEAGKTPRLSLQNCVLSVAMDRTRIDRLIWRIERSGGGFTALWDCPISTIVKVVNGEL